VAGEALRIRVRCDSCAPRLIRQALEGIPELNGCCQDALLVASELVTNAVQHSHCPEGGLLTVWLDCQENHVQITVVDPGLSGEEAQITDRPLGAGGLGRKVVQELAASWGAERQRDGYRVWADVPLAA
jgi:anti-sigma regulatory factor (Ser/Thr protein kinase)